MGATYLAGLAVGYWSSKEDVIKNWAIDEPLGRRSRLLRRNVSVAGTRLAKYAYGWAKKIKPDIK